LCKKERESQTQNKLPIAKAGADQIIKLPLDSTVLDGTASGDADGTIVSYRWSKIAGPDSFLIRNSDSAKTTILRLDQGIYLFVLSVKDNGGLVARDTVEIFVNAPSPPPPPPPPTSLPEVAFWSDESYQCLCDPDPVTITINNVSKILSDFPWGRVNDCYSSYTVRFTLNPGTYNWKAVRGSDSTGGSINVSALNACVLQEIKF
jgi:hypothetical protein